ncbi:MAG TPA: nucleoside recognition domain-containing protein [Saprospiraceae bacterium]|nr:nucleoside recognition domain-containing protein [Saprospiraceae bacterium]
MENSGPNIDQQAKELESLMARVRDLRWQFGDETYDLYLESVYDASQKIVSAVVKKPGETRALKLETKIDRVVTSKKWGFPIMFLLLAAVFWFTIVGTNYPSQWLSLLLVDTVHPWLKSMAELTELPFWISGLLIDGIYLTTAWVVSVMLPPMAIFFPMFTLLEDFGYLPRVAFNLDNVYRKVGAHGKQALTMSMGFGCNVTGVIASRIIDSPRERLIAIITNNFSLCNGRWPTQILIATIFIGSLAPSYLGGIVSAASVIAVALLGIFMSLLVSWGLHKTVLKGEASSFSLELPPYRPPRIKTILYTSLIDRTLVVLGRSVMFAIPAGMVIWLSVNISIDGKSLAFYLTEWMDPVALFFGLNGIIFLAYIIAIPANEIVLPTILLLTVLGSSVSGQEGMTMISANSALETADILKAGGWTLLTAVNLMLFSLLHNPCSTTIYTIYKETKSLKWTMYATFIPIVLGLVVTFLVARIWEIFG